MRCCTCAAALIVALPASTGFVGIKHAHQLRAPMLSSRGSSVPPELSLHRAASGGDRRVLVAPLSALKQPNDAVEKSAKALGDATPVPSGGSGGIRQLLGVKGADVTQEKWKIRLQLTKPVTWIPLIWGVICGAAASGNYHTWNPFGGDVSLGDAGADLAKAIGCMVLAGPFLTGYTQTINDWYDREIDAINEPYRPIPSGAISEGEVIAQIWVLLLGGLGLAYGLDLWAGHDFPTILALSVGGSFVSYIYSAPPLKLKQNGWIGNYALGSSYISLPWWCGQAMFGQLNMQVVILTLLYSWAGLGIAIVNDFKSVEGDRALGLQSLPVAFGVENAKYICVASIDLTQMGIAAWLYSIGEPIYAAVLAALIAPQVFAQFKFFLPDPVANDVKYQATAQPFLVLGILCTALAVGHHQF